MRVKLRTIVDHGITVCLIIFLTAGIPILRYAEDLGIRFGQGGDADAVSSASVALPDQPSGEYIVAVNTALHKDSMEEWRNFFNDREFSVIFEDVDCLIPNGDGGAMQLAERFAAQLPENQMRFRTESATLVASKAEEGYIDVAIFSKEMADALSLTYQGGEDTGIEWMEIKGAE